MRTKIKSLSVLIVLILSMIAVIDLNYKFVLNVKAPTTWYVDDVPGGSPPEDFTSIQDAINASSDGDTVFVYNGTYYENIVVNKTINLIGEDNNGTIIDAGKVGNVIYVEATWANITEFSIINGGSGIYAGIKLYNAQNCILLNNNILNNSAGIYLDSSNNNNIIKNNASNNFYGFRIDSSNMINIRNNTVFNCRYGIYIYNSYIGHNITNNNVNSNIEYGIYLWDSQGSNISDNYVVNNDDHGIFVSINNGSILNNYVYLNNGTGIYLRDSFDNIITNNIAIANQYSGLHLFDSERNHVLGNNASHNKYGIYLHSSNENEINLNRIYFNEYNGIHCSGDTGEYSNRNNITFNEIWNNNQGIVMLGSKENNIKLNNISYNRYGISLSSAILHNLTENQMVGNGISLSGYNLENWNTHNIDTSNFVNGKPVYYWKNLTGGIVPADGGQIILGNCTNVIIENQNLTNGTVGIQIGFSINIKIINNNVSSNNIVGISLTYSNYNNVSNNTISNNDWGLYISASRYNNITNNSIYLNDNGTVLYASHYNNISNNNISKNYWDGIFLDTSYLNNISRNIVSFNYRNGIHLGWTSSNGNIVTNNTLSLNHKQGLYLYYSRNNYITKNIMSENGIVIWGNSLDYWNTHHIDTSNTVNGKPVYYWKNETGGTIPFGAGQIILANCSNMKIENQDLNNASVSIELGYSSNNNLTNNNASLNNFVGICLYYSSDNNILNNNIFLNKEYGIYLYQSFNNRIYYNNLMSNTEQAIDDQSDNFWDNGYPSGGNYWSDYTGVDNFKGPNQNITGSDGIGDTPYTNILGGAGAQDNYPLMAPYISFENYSVLKQGWNLISIPLIQNEQNLTRVLGSIDGWYDAVQWYSITDINDSWKHNKIGKPFGNDLYELNESMGFWIHITQPGDTIFVYNGTELTINHTISLFPGWNLVGYPSKSNKNRTAALNNINFSSDVDAIWTYNTTTQTWKEITASDNFEVGGGYWMHSKVTKTWIVPL